MSLIRPGDGDRFRLGLRVVELGLGALRRLDVRRAAFPYMEQLVERFQETCDLGILDRGEVLYVEVVHSQHSLTIAVRVGRRLPAYCTASGMAAIAGTLFGLCNSGDHIVSSNTVYGGTYALLHDFLPAKAGITTTLVEITDLEAVEAAIRPNTKALYAESIANPTLRVANIPALADIAHRHGLKLVIDNTFSPLILSPKQLGADIVVHSLTKFIGGASDHIAGANVVVADDVATLDAGGYGAITNTGTN